jgi:ssDNA-binding replication factor A large subunit
MTEIDLEKIPWKESDVVSKINKLKPIDVKIKDVNSEVKWVNLKAKVVKKPIARTVYSRFGNNPLGLSTSTISDDTGSLTRFGNNPLGLSTSTISDDTGSIKMPLWNNQINMVSIGDTIQIENGRIRTFRGELQVSVGKAGKLKVIKAQPK